MLGAQEELAAAGHVISSHCIHLTKNVVATLAVGAVVLALSTFSAHAACGQAPDRSSGLERRATIFLQDPDVKGPVYYWHDSSTFALLYFRPEDLVARLQTLLESEQGANRLSSFGNATLVPALLDNIKVDLPLKESTDLFRYSIIDPRFDSVVNFVIADLLREGKVMLDQWMLVEHPGKSIVMVSRGDANGEEGGRWFCTTTDEVLFKIGHAASD